MTPSNLYKIAKFFPDMIVVAAHCGCPWQSELLSLCIGHCPNFYMDISGGDTDTLFNFVEIRGMFPGTDCDDVPCVLADKIMSGIDAYLGEPQLHEDVRNARHQMDDWLEKCIDANHWLVDKMPGIFYKTAEKLMSRNQLFSK